WGDAAGRAESEGRRQRRSRGAAEKPARRDYDQDLGDSASDEPTHVNSLLKSTPSILPRDRRTRFCARIGSRSSSGRRNIMRISIFTPPPSAAFSAGAYSIFSCTHPFWRSAAGMASRSAGVGWTFTPAPAGG